MQPENLASPPPARPPPTFVIAIWSHPGGRQEVEVHDQQGEVLVSGISFQVAAITFRGAWKGLVALWRVRSLFRPTKT